MINVCMLYSIFKCWTINVDNNCIEIFDLVHVVEGYIGLEDICISSWASGFYLLHCRPFVYLWMVYLHLDWPILYLSFDF